MGDTEENMETWIVLLSGEWGLGLIFRWFGYKEGLVFAITTGMPPLVVLFTNVYKPSHK